MQLKIKKNKTADTRTCDYANVTKETLIESSKQHIQDVGLAMSMFSTMLSDAAIKHDSDKLSGIDHFHSDFLTGFREIGWYENHVKINRHHLESDKGIPADVNLIDVLEMIADCMMAGMARSGEPYPIMLPPDVLQRAFQNTAKLLKEMIIVKD